MAGNSGHGEHPSKITIIFVINGENFTVDTNTNAPLSSAVERALSESGNTGRRDPGEWEVRNTQGVLLDISAKLGDLSLTDGVKLFLNVRVGAGGATR